MAFILAKNLNKSKRCIFIAKIKSKLIKHLSLFEAF